MHRSIALRPGVFIGYSEGFSFVSKLEEVAAKIRKLGATEPGRAVGLYETFLAGCHAKADELDDSDGSFGQFAHELICLWIKARQASGAEPDKTASTLLAWMDDDPYAFCHEIEKDAAAAFDKAGLAIQSVQRGGVKALPDDRALERIREIIALADELTGDFRRVRDEFDKLNRHLRESLMENEGNRGDVLAALFAGVDLIGESDAGKTGSPQESGKMFICRGF